MSLIAELHAHAQRHADHNYGRYPTDLFVADGDVDGLAAELSTQWLRDPERRSLDHYSPAEVAKWIRRGGMMLFGCNLIVGSSP